jgi:hypothetical protein
MTTSRTFRVSSSFRSPTSWLQISIHVPSDVPLALSGVVDDCPNASVITTSKQPSS